MDIRKLEKIIQNHKDEKIYREKLPEAILKFYTKSEKTIEVQNKILSLVDSEFPRSIDWATVFESEVELSRKIDLQLTHSWAKKLHDKNVIDESTMEMVASHAYYNCANKESDFFDLEKEKIWLDTFKDMSQFKIHFDNNKPVESVSKKLKM